METKKRIDEIDMAKGLGILIVFLIHTLEYTGISAYAAPIYNFIHTFSEAWMILFILLSGYTYRPKATLKADLTGKAKGWLLPYLYGCIGCGVFYVIADLLIGKMNGITFLQRLVTCFLGGGNLNFFVEDFVGNPLCYSFTAFWYINEVFVSFILMLVVYRLIRSRGTAFKFCTALVLLGAGMVLYLLDLQGTVENTFLACFSYFFVLPNIFGFAGVLLIGSVLRDLHLLDVDSYPKRLSVTMAVISAAVWLTFSLLYDCSYALQCGKWGPYGVLSIPVTTLCGVALTYLVVFVFHYAKKLRPVKSVFSYLGRHSMYILLSHYVFCEFLSFLFGKRYEIYGTGFPEEAFSLPIAIGIVLMTAVLTVGSLEIKNRISRKLK